MLHHVEVCVKDDKIINLLRRGFGFTPFAHRVTRAASKLALRSGNSIFVIVQRNSLVNRSQVQDGDSSVREEDRSGLINPNEFNVDHENKDLNDTAEPKQMNHILESVRSNVKTVSNLHFQDDGEHWTVFCCEGAPCHTIDSVFNVALAVKDVDAVTKRVKSRGGQVLKEPSNFSDANGVVRYSIVTSCCGNIVHTLIDKKMYSGTFLPGFETLDNDEGKLSFHDAVVDGFSNRQNSSSFHQLESTGVQNSTAVPQDRNHVHLHQTEDCSTLSPPISTHIDHVTYVCEIGKSKDLISWYEFCFGMKRFKTNITESETEGFVLGDNIGLRLKVMEYWKCAETGLGPPDADSCDTSLKLVIAEPLPEVSTSHVDAFLRAHRGPGVQHIGLHTPTMVATVDFMSRNGVVFRKAPPVYYEEGIKLDEIKEAGHGNEVELFQELGILLDTEADVLTETEKNEDKKSYLMQVFTGPLFDENTFFLEVIQRRGARGFGAGNIKALAKSIILHNQKVEDSKDDAH